MSNILKRLQKLESRMPNRPTELDRSYSSAFRMLVIGYYLGDPRPEESYLEAHARALGYANSREALNAVNANPADFHERHERANTQILAKFGVSRNDNPAVLTEALDRMKNGLSEPYRRQLVQIAGYYRLSVEFD